MYESLCGDIQLSQFQAAPHIALFDPVQLFNCLVEGKLAQTNGAAAIPSCSPSQALATRPIPHTGSPIAVTISLSQTHSY